jgi:hypothetical protein
MGLAQSAWSRLESGVNALTIDQVREAAAHLGVQPQHIFAAAEEAAARLVDQGVHVKTAKPSALGSGLVLVTTAIVGAAVGAALVRKRSK